MMDSDSIPFGTKPVAQSIQLVHSCSSSISSAEVLDGNHARAKSLACPGLLAYAWRFPRAVSRHFFPRHLLALFHRSPQWTEASTSFPVEKEAVRADSRLASILPRLSRWHILCCFLPSQSQWGQIHRIIIRRRILHKFKRHNNEPPTASVPADAGGRAPIRRKRRKGRQQQQHRPGTEDGIAGIALRQSGGRRSVSCSSRRHRGSGLFAGGQHADADDGLPACRVLQPQSSQQQRSWQR